MTAEIYLWGTRIGIVWQPDGQAAKFEYDADFIQSGIELAPIMMPLSRTVYSFPELNRIQAFHGMPGLLADSLPDRFGNAVIEEWLKRQGRTLGSFTAVERLCYTGKRGMGALEYVPSVGPDMECSNIDVTKMSDFASEIISGRKSVALKDRDMNLMQLMEIGSSAGGARAKAVVAWNEKTGEIKSGQIDAGAGFGYWLIKFDGVAENGDHGVADPKQYTSIEYAYSMIAKDAGINMEECRLLEKDGRFHFMTSRYDRKDGHKLHVQTLGALGHYDYNQPRCCSYEIYAHIAKQLGMGKDSMQELYRRVVYNFMGVNCDDHVKNFAFLMNRKGEWSLSPAYDLTFAYNPGNKWLSEHQMTVCGKSMNVTVWDLLEFGKSINLSKQFCENTVEQISDLFDQWMDYATRCQISEMRAVEIKQVIDKNRPSLK